MRASDLKRASRPVKLMFFLTLVIVAWHLSAPTPYQDNLVDVMETSDPHGYIPFFVFLVATGLFVHDWPRAEFAAGAAIAAIALHRGLSHEIQARRVVAAEDLTAIAQQPGMLHLLGLCAGLLLMVSGALGLRRRGRRRRRSLLFLGATVARRSGGPGASPGATVSDRPPLFAAEAELAPALRAEREGDDDDDDGEPLSVLFRRLRDPDPAVREAAIVALEERLGRGLGRGR